MSGGQAVGRVRLRVTGQVQGVGFRPFVYRLATELGLVGGVSNDPAGVTIEVQGLLAALDAFIRRLQAEAPPLARIERLTQKRLTPREEARFAVLPSEIGGTPVGEMSSAGAARAVREDPAGQDRPGHTAAGRKNGVRHLDERVSDTIFPLIRADVTPDASVCADCLRELADPRDRRYRYPFINCTNCGPRYTIIFDIPYDRPATTMAGFRMCADCAAEYHDPTSRRFHAQPNACPVCGPRLELRKMQNSPSDEGTESGSKIGCSVPRPGFSVRVAFETREVPAGQDRPGHMTEGMENGVRHPDGKVSDTVFRQDALQRAAAALRAGLTVAVKGLGGFHLACLATDAAAVARLRERKRREAKPLAVMIRSLDEARRYAHVSDAEAAALTSIERPICLLRKRAGAVVRGDGVRHPDGNVSDSMLPGGGIAGEVAPRSQYQGLMLPYTPLHVLLLDAVGAPLVMTSGNISDEPICRTSDEADRRLGGIADLVLTHNRPIYTACDDSVVREDVGRVRVLRRSRGYVPVPIAIPIAAAEPILAVGPEFKNTVAVAVGEKVILSHHVGDLKNTRAEDFFRHAIATLCRTLDVRPTVVVHDLHPQYRSTQYARRRADVRLIGVQHHHAHVAAVMAEQGLTGAVIGVVCDGTGYGADGTTWGCEFLLADEREYRRVGHLANAALPGGDRAAEEPWRMALSWLVQAVGDEADQTAAALLPEIGKTERRVIIGMCRRRVNAPSASSLGRLFDAVSALAGVCLVNRYEAQAPIELEAVMDSQADGDYDWVLSETAEGFVVDPSPLIRGVAADRHAGASAGVIAARFHRGVAAFLTEGARRVRHETGVSRVALTGGSFQNAWLLREVHGRLAEDGFEVYLHERVPPNDGGVALGQAYVAAARLAAARA